MRLAVFTNNFPGRVTTFFARDMRALIEAGIEVDIFPIYPLNAKMWRYVPDILSEEVLPRDRVHHLSLGQCLAAGPSYPKPFIRHASRVCVSAMSAGAKPVAKTAYSVIKAATWARQHGRTFDHVLGYWGNYAATSAYVFHRITNPEVPFSIWLHAGTDLYRGGVYLREKMLYADNIVTCCDFNRKFLRETYPDLWDRIGRKIHVCAHGLDFKEFPFVPDGRSPRKILAVGRLVRLKGYEILLAAAGLLRDRNVDFQVEFIGDGYQAPVLQARARELGIEDRVVFRGWLPFTEVRKAMTQATVLVHPSPELGDGVPNVIKEAVAVGTPIVASNVAGISELLDDGRCGILVPPKDVHSLAQAIESLFENPDQCRQFGKAARERAEERFDLWHNGRLLAERLMATRRSAASVA